MTAAARVRRYRERHRDTTARVDIYISTDSRERLARLARHRGEGITATIENLLAEAERRLLEGFNGFERDLYRRRLR